MIFYHVKRVHDWTILAAHVFEPGMHSMMTTVTFDMKEEDTKS